jgi:hypothetical protein
MNDLDLITQLQPHEPLPGTRELAPARRRLTDAIAAELSPAQAPTVVHPFFEQQRPTSPAVPSRPDRPGRRRAFAIVALTAAAAGVAATVLIAVPGTRGHPTAGPSARSTASSHPAQASRVRPFTGRLTVARFLDAAARAALTQPARPPRPDQYVYSETEGPGGYRYQIWQSADGSRNGLVINRVGPGGLPICTVAQAEATHCATTAGYLPGLPVRPGAVLAFLIKVGLAGQADQGGGSKLHKPIAHWIANDLGKTLMVMLANNYLRPDQRAALYEFMARTPGFTVAPHAVDALGQPGIGIRWTFEGTVSTIIFSRRNYAYLGFTSTYDGQPSFSDALVRFAIVDHLPHVTPGPHAGPVLKAKPGATPSHVPGSRG